MASAVDHMHASNITHRYDYAFYLLEVTQNVALVTETRIVFFVILRTTT